MQPDPTMLTRLEAARRLSLSVSTLDRMLRKGMLPYVALGPRLIRIRTTAIEALLREGEAP